MPISFNIEDSFFYQQGVAAEKAIHEEEIARIKAEEDAMIPSLVTKMLRSKILTDQQIADCLKLSLEYVQDIKTNII